MKNENGQALVCGIFCIFMSLLVFLYFFSVVELKHHYFSNLMSAKIEKLEEVTKYSNILNEISYNNRNILISVMDAEISFISAFEHGETISYEQPYWETYSVINNKNVNSSLSNKTTESIDFAYNSFKLNTARALFTAKALSERNKFLLSLFPSKLEIDKLFLQNSPAQVNCMALELLSSEVNPSHYEKFLISPSYNFGLSRKSCTLVNTQNISRKITNKSLPFILYNSKDIVIDFSKFNELFYNNLNYYGITYVDFKDANKFRNSLSFLTNDLITSDRNKPYFIEYLSKINYFKNQLSYFVLNKNKVIKKSVIYIDHPNIPCISSSFNSVNKKICRFNEEEFFKSFFMMNWSPIVEFQENSL